MATPITNNSPALVANNKAQRPEVQGLGGGQGQGAVVSADSGTQDDGVTVSRAAQVLSQQPAERGNGAIQSADHAAQVAKGLRALFEGNSGQALAAQAVRITPDMMELLKAG